MENPDKTEFSVQCRPSPYREDWFQMNVWAIQKYHRLRKLKRLFWLSLQNRKWPVRLRDMRIFISDWLGRCFGMKMLANERRQIYMTSEICGWVGKAPFTGLRVRIPVSTAGIWMAKEMVLDCKVAPKQPCLSAVHYKAHSTWLTLS